MTKDAKVERTCKTCGTSFRVSPSNHAKYCSKHCMYHRNDAAFDRVCECCGKAFRVRTQFEETRTCSLECGYKVRRVANKLEPVQVFCEHCGKMELLPPSLAVGYRFCSSECKFASPVYKAEQSSRVSGENNPTYTGDTVSCVSATGKVYSRQHPAKENAKLARRRATKRRAAVDWANAEKLQWFYAEAQRISATTGMTYHVDHIVPLTSRKVCGLHNEFNLQILPAFDNLSKGNKHWPNQ